MHQGNLILWLHHTGDELVKALVPVVGVVKVTRACRVQVCEGGGGGPYCPHRVTRARLTFSVHAALLPHTAPSL